MAEATSECLQGTLERYRALLEISELIALHRHFADLFRELNRSLSRIIPFEGIGISLYDTAQRTTQLFLLETGKPNDIPVGRTFLLEDTPASEILKTRQPLYVPDLEQETRFPVINDMLRRHGTLFLDEIGDIPLELQPKLLRVLQDKEFERLGSARTIHADVRLIAATNRDLSQMVRDGEFRADLYYRLNVFPIVMPPLRDRREDIPLLVRYFVQQVARRMGKLIKTIHLDTMNALARYAWPGNIRELQNIIERAVILTSSTVLKVPVGELKTPIAAPGERPQTLEEAERRHILQVLHEANWVVGGPHGAAARLGMKRSTLQFRMQKLGIFRPR